MKRFILITALLLIPTLILAQSGVLRDNTKVTKVEFNSNKEQVRIDTSTNRTDIDALASGNLELYLSSRVATSGGYRLFLTSVPTIAETTIITSMNAATVFISSWTTDNPVDLSTLVGGTYDLHFHAEMNNTDRDVRIGFNVYHTTGASTTFLFSSEQSNLIIADKQSYTIHGSTEEITGAISYLVVEVVAYVIGAAAAPNLTFYMEGDNATRFGAPALLGDVGVTSIIAGTNITTNQEKGNVMVSVTDGSFLVNSSGTVIEGRLDDVSVGTTTVQDQADTNTTDIGTNVSDIGDNVTAISDNKGEIDDLTTSSNTQQILIESLEAWMTDMQSSTPTYTTDTEYLELKVSTQANKPYSTVVVKRGAVDGTADFYCDGTDDQTQINLAIQAVGTGGTVMCMEGQYDVDAGVATLAVNIGSVTLKGQGNGTIFLCDDSSGPGNLVLSITGGGCTVRDISFISVISDLGSFIRASSGGHNANIIGCTLLTTAAGLSGEAITSSVQTNIINCRLYVDGSNVAIGGMGNDSKIINNRIQTDSQNCTAMSSGDDIIVTGNTFIGDIGIDINSSNVDRMLITGNNFNGCTQAIDDGGTLTSAWSNIGADGNWAVNIGSQIITLDQVIRGNQTIEVYVYGSTIAARTNEGVMFRTDGLTGGFHLKDDGTIGHKASADGEGHDSTGWDNIGANSFTIGAAFAISGADGDDGDVLTSDGAGGVTLEAPGGGGGGTSVAGSTECTRFNICSFIPSSFNGAVISINGYAQGASSIVYTSLDFKDSDKRSAYKVITLPDFFDPSVDVQMFITWIASPTANEAVFNIEISTAQNWETDVWTQQATTTTVNSTSLRFTKAQIQFNTGHNIVPGNPFKIKIERIADATADDMTGTAKLIGDMMIYWRRAW